MTIGYEAVFCVLVYEFRYYHCGECQDYGHLGFDTMYFDT